jgi:hypothetical protein
MMCKTECTVTKLSACALGISFGIVEGLFMLVYALIALYCGHGGAMIQQLSDIYPGYAATIPGALIGGLWGFVIGFIFGTVVGGLYNLCLCCCSKKSAESTENK